MAGSGCEMPCFHPISGYRSRTVNANGKRPIVFNRRSGYVDLPVDLPCGQCIGCRLEKSRQWATRCMHEAQMFSENCFITLTYDPKFIPAGNTLVKKDFQTFMKRLRKKFIGTPIRYFHCGEYGDLNRRPHYHAIIFNLDFSDKILYSEKNSVLLYTSATLQKLWQLGFSTIGEVTFESAAYVARYAMKKITGHTAKSHYENIDLETGEITDMQAEYITMSLKPGIGSKWFEKFASDVYPSDEVIMRGHRVKPPRYYDTIYEKVHPKKMEKIKFRRIKKASKHKSDSTPERLSDREIVKKAQINFLKRKLE